MGILQNIFKAIKICSEEESSRDRLVFLWWGFFQLVWLQEFQGNSNKERNVEVGLSGLNSWE